LTLVEIMVVTAILAVLAALVIPNLLRARISAFEAITIQHMKTLQDALTVYYANQRSYPDDWQLDMYTSANPPFGPAQFNVNMQVWQTVQGYEYLYEPWKESMGVACGAGEDCQQYALHARPAQFGLTGTRSFIAGLSFGLRHCQGSAQDQQAGGDHPPITGPPAPC